MDENQLGKNIQCLRESHKETLEELGNVIGFQKSAGEMHQKVVQYGINYEYFCSRFPCVCTEK